MFGTLESIQEKKTQTKGWTFYISIILEDKSTSLLIHFYI